MNNKKYLWLMVILGLCSCSEPVRTEVKDDGTRVEYVERDGGLMEHMAGAAVAGAAAGAAGAAAHRVTDHAINRWEERRMNRHRGIKGRRR